MYSFFYDLKFFISKIKFFFTLKTLVNYKSMQLSNLIMFHDGHLNFFKRSHSIFDSFHLIFWKGFHIFSLASL